MATRKPARSEKPESEPDLERFGELMALHGAESRLYLYRVAPRLPGSKEESWLERFDEAAPTLEQIREEYGGGTFRLRLLDGGKRVPGAEVLFSIEGEPRFTAGAAAPASWPGAPAPGQDRIDRLLTLLERKLSAEDDEDRRESRRRERMLADMAMAREFARGGQSNPEDTINLALRMVELFREGAASAGGGSVVHDPGAPWWSELVTSLAEVLTRPAPAMRARPNPAMAVAPANAAPPPTLPPTQGQPMNLPKLLDDLAELLSDEALTAKELLPSFRQLPSDMIRSIVDAGRESWLAFFVRESHNRPVLATPRAQLVLGELWDLLAAPPAP